MRGYHSANHQEPGYEDGVLPTTYYYVPKENERTMHQYSALTGAFFNREFPTSWRDVSLSHANLLSFAPDQSLTLIDTLTVYAD
jgi:hypothetical protein